jgi:hypothetical protein
LASGFLAVLWLGQGAAQAAEITVLGGMGVISGIRDLTVRDKWRKGVEAMDVVTNALDNSLRLAAYTAARRNRVPVYIIDALLESTESRSCKQPLAPGEYNVRREGQPHQVRQMRPVRVAITWRGTTHINASDLLAPLRHPSTSTGSRRGLAAPGAAAGRAQEAASALRFLIARRHGDAHSAARRHAAVDRDLLGIPGKDLAQLPDRVWIRTLQSPSKALDDRALSPRTFANERRARDRAARLPVAECLVSEEAAIAEAAFVAVNESGPVQGFGCRPARTVRDPPAAGVRKPPRNEPAEGPRCGARR